MELWLCRSRKGSTPRGEDFGIFGQEKNHGPGVFSAVRHRSLVGNRLRKGNFRSKGWVIVIHIFKHEDDFGISRGDYPPLNATVFPPKK